MMYKNLDTKLANIHLYYHFEGLEFNEDEWSSIILRNDRAALQINSRSSITFRLKRTAKEYKRRLNIELLLEE